MHFYYGVIVTSWAVFIVVWLIAALGAKRNLPSRSFTVSWSIRLLIIIVLFLLFRYAHFDPTAGDFANGYPALAALGALLTLAGIALAIWARFYLGTNWGMPMSHKENAELVTTGPYSYIRHPIYTGVLLAMLGSALATGLGWLVIFIVFFAYFLYSAGREEARMRGLFPDAYPAYKARTKMLVPFVF